MTARRDLTRWNRAGLRRLRYVDATAVEHFEALRAELARRFDAYGDPREATEDALGRARRLVEQYQAPTGDPVLELMRVLARATHVLTEHIDAYANEGFIETATQWDPVRRLVHLLGYHPAPPASAETWLVVLSKALARGTLERGFQVKHAPADGGAPVLFETLHDLALDDRLDALRLAGHDLSVERFDPFAGAATTAWRRGDAPKLSVGQVALLLQQAMPRPPGLAAAALVPTRALPVSITVLGDDGAVVVGTAAPPPVGQADWQLGHTRLLAVPAKVWRPQLNGPARIVLDRPHGLAAGDVVVWAEGGGWRFAGVDAAQGLALRLAQAALPPLGAVLHRAGLVAAAPAGELRLPLPLDAAAQPAAAGAWVPIDIKAALQTGTLDNGKPAPYLVPRVAGAITPPVAVFVQAQAVLAGRVAARGSPVGCFEFDGAPVGLASGQWLVAESGQDSAGQPRRHAVHIDRIDEREGRFTLTLSTGSAPAAPVAPEALAELQLRLVDVEAALDQQAWQTLTLADLALGRAGALAASAIQGVGGARAAGGYAQPLRRHGIVTLADLAAWDLGRAVAGLSSVRLREFQAKARRVHGFAVDSARFAPLLGMALAQVLALAPGSGGGGTAEVAPIDRLERLHGPLREVLAPRGHDRNGSAPDAGTLRLAFDADAPAALRPPPLPKGRLLVLEHHAGDGGIVARRAVVESQTANVVALATPWPDLRGFTLAGTVVRANVVPAGHGETRAEKVLGSGNAALLHQEFRLPVAGVSFIADATMPAGVRADIALQIDGRTWQQVGTLADSGPADAHYTVRVTEQGELRIGFGDGRRGRRLPTGSNNVRAVYRSGSGLAGNLAAGCLRQPARPHRLVAGVQQPLPAVGGNDLETVAALRRAAPASLLTLERAVSLSDFAHLAASQASIWQARAFARAAPPGVREAVEVVLVPAGGAALDPATLAVDRCALEPLLAQQAAWLRAHALPGTVVIASVFEPLPVDLEIEVWTRAAEFDTEHTLEAVRAALRALLALRGRALGQPLHRSALYQTVEAVAGVEYSRCTMRRHDGRGDAAPETLQPTPRQVVYLDPVHSTLHVVAREFEL